MDLTQVLSSPITILVVTFIAGFIMPFIIIGFNHWLDGKRPNNPAPNYTYYIVNQTPAQNAPQKRSILVRLLLIIVSPLLCIIAVNQFVFRINLIAFLSAVLGSLTSLLVIFLFRRGRRR
jgi:hypothetical protein